MAHGGVDLGDGVEAQDREEDQVQRLWQRHAQVLTRLHTSCRHDDGAANEKKEKKNETAATNSRHSHTIHTSSSLKEEENTT
jgi:hypothetical protein